MRRLLSILCATAAVSGGAAAWSLLPEADDAVEVPAPAPRKQPSLQRDAGAGGELREARRKCSLPALDAVVVKLRDAAEATPADAARWRLLAEAHLERAQQRGHLRGMAVGQPVYDELPKALAADLDAGAAAVAKARELGDASAALYRIEAGLMSQRITGWTSALQWNGRIGDALARAGEADADDPALHVALGLRKLLAPKMFGHDPAKALEHFEFAATRGNDERPAVFAAMASYLQDEQRQAVAWLEKAVANNPANKFARVVLERLRRGEDEPFSRDVTEAQASAPAKLVTDR